MRAPIGEFLAAVEPLRTGYSGLPVRSSATQTKKCSVPVRMPFICGLCSITDIPQRCVKRRAKHAHARAHTDGTIVSRQVV